jgi:dolichol kinase
MQNTKLKTELVRKGIHFLIAFIPFIAAFSYTLAIILLYTATLLYMILETLRLYGINVPGFAIITKLASRPRDKGKFVFGPVTLALGALLSLILFSPNTAAIAIFALAFGDGFSGIFGRAFGRIRPQFLCGKSVEGSFSCFIAVLISTWYASGNLKITLIAAITAVSVEALPLRDWDNIVFPLVVGAALGV